MGYNIDIYLIFSIYYIYNYTRFFKSWPSFNPFLWPFQGWKRDLHFGESKGRAVRQKKTRPATVDGRNPKQPPGMGRKPIVNIGIFTRSTGACRISSFHRRISSFRQFNYYYYRFYYVLFLANFPINLVSHDKNRLYPIPWNPALMMKEA